MGEPLHTSHPEIENFLKAFGVEMGTGITKIVLVAEAGNIVKVYLTREFQVADLLQFRTVMETYKLVKA